MSHYFTIMFLGRVISITNRSDYVKIVIGVETGYNTTYYTARTREFLEIQDVEEGDKVIFSGYTLIKESHAFFLESIVPFDFESCSICNLPLTSSSCLRKHDSEAQRLDGTWNVIHKIVSKTGPIKVFFQRERFVFAALSTPQEWYNDIFVELKEGDMVKVEG